MGQALPTSQTHLLGLMISDVANPFYSQLIRGAQIAATQAGYEILLADCRESGTRERAALERLVPVVDFKGRRLAAPPAALPEGLAASPNDEEEGARIQ